MRGLQKLKVPRSLIRTHGKDFGLQCPTTDLSRRSSSTVVKSLEDIPGPRSLPVIGTLYNYLPGGPLSLSKPYNSGLALKSRYGPIVREEIVPGVVLIRLYNPNDIEAVFKVEGKMPHRLPVFPLKQYRDLRGRVGGLATVNGEEWSKYRSLVQQKMMRPAEVAAYIPTQEDVSEDFVKRIKLLRDNKNEVPNFLQELYRWACESIGVVCFDRRVGILDMDGNEEAIEFITNVNKVFSRMHRALFLTKITKAGFMTKTFRELCDAFDVLWDFTGKYVDMAEKNAVNNESLLLKMLSTPNLKREEALVMISDLFVGGVDTTAHAFAFNLYHLAKNPEKQQRLYEEIMNTMQEGVPLTSRLVNDMPYLRACMKETNRMTPTVVPGTMRFVEKEVVLSGYRIPAGAGVHFGNDVICRMPEYFEEPETFKPERWLREEKSGTPIHPFALLPFGHGPRMCIGRRLAEQEIVIGLVKLLKAFEIQYHYEDIGQVLRLVNMPDKPLRFTLVDRR